MGQSLRGARLRGADLSGVVGRGVYAKTLDLSGEFGSLVVNGVEVMPLVEAELDRRHPDRVRMRPVDADGFRVAWEIVEGLWARTVARARSLPEERLHERVDDEWSFIETLRHLLFATDSWVLRVILGDPAPWDPLDLPFDEMSGADDGVPWDRAARPSLEEVLALRADRMAVVRRVLAGLTDAELDRATGLTPGWPEPVGTPVRLCLRIILNEEWEHRLFAERDLGILLGS
ncbi:DinB family protein [Winogradskya consettensis]|uniref:DinB-like domain-containing protein n=1 Tax=Winogradskya consettensis TaxID=113560 RepID=A0A919T0S5_9ACTN|nr:hypothetical protein Aco04nite_73400 [Actinoplanes consettensis]